MAAGEAIAIQNILPVLATPAEWCAVLEQAGAVVENRIVRRYGEEAAELAQAQTGDVMADLSHFGLIAVEGPEAQKFLGSLFTGDVRLVTPMLGQFTSWCDGKGRMQATFWLFMRGETYYLLLPQDLLEPTLARLKQFLLRTKATITDASASLVRLGLSGAGMEQRLSTLLGGKPPQALAATAELNGCTFLALPGGGRWLVIGRSENITALWDGLRPDTALVGAEAWELLDIMAGIPNLLPATAGEFIPQMVDLEALGGLSFKKGCYPGQEVVARLQYRGQLKRRLYKASIDADAVPEPGTKLYGEGTGESVGMVLSAARQAPGKIALLAVVVIEQKTSGEIRLGDLQGSRLAFAEEEASAGA